MSTILHIDASVQPDPQRSLSKRLSRAFMDAWFEQAPETTVITRDIGANPPPLISGAWGEFGFEPGEVNEAKNHLETHIRTCAHYLGVDEIHAIGIDYQEFGDARHDASVRDAFAAVPALVDELTVTA